jgi:hypothetical protein
MAFDLLTHGAVAPPLQKISPELPGKRNAGRFKPFALYIAVFLPLSIFTNPYQPDEEHTRRYLLPVFRAADASLFRNDPAVDAMLRFRSIFYDGLAATVKAFRLTPAEVQAALQASYLPLTAALLCMIYLIVRELEPHPVTVWFAGLFACQPRNALLGGDGLFYASVTHREIAILLGLIAIYCALRTRSDWAGATLAIAVLIHAVLAVALFLAIAPATGWRCRSAAGRSLAGIAMFGSSCAVYLLFLRPPALGEAGSRIFLEAKGSINHVSLLNQGAGQWVVTSLLLALALLAWRALEPISESVRRAGAFMIFSAGCAIVLSAAFLATRIPLLAQLQPMRGFTWATLFIYLLLIAAAGRALERDRNLALLLIAATALTLAGARAGIAFAFAANLYLLFGRMLCREFWTAGIQLLALATLAGALVPALVPLAAAVEPVTAVVAACILMLLVPRVRMLQSAAIGFIAAAVAWAGAVREIDVRRHSAASDWLQVAAWCRTHTSPDARFLTPPDTSDFRFYALRTPVAEPVNALLWVDPLLYRSDNERRQHLRQAYAGPACDGAGIVNLACRWNAEYLIVPGGCAPHGKPLFQQNSFSVYSVR